MQIHLTGQEKCGILAAQLKGPANKTMRAELSKALRVAVKPAVMEAKAAVLALQITSQGGGGRAQRATKSGRHRGLRAATASGIRTKVDYGRPDIRIQVRPNLPADQKNLPRYMNKPAGWRHPVYGHRDRWVRQRGSQWFEPAIFRHRSGIADACGEALDATARSIAASVRH